MLDHEDFEESVTMLLDPLLRDDDVTPQHHRAILTSLLAQGEHCLALRYTQGCFFRYLLPSLAAVKVLEAKKRIKRRDSSKLN